MRKSLRLLLGTLALVAFVSCQQSKEKVLDFEEQFNNRRDVCAVKLNAIRTLEVAFMEQHGRYTASFDTLLFSAKDILDMDSNCIKNLRYIPFPEESREEFILQAGYIEQEGIKVPVFECKVPFEILLSDLDDQSVMNKVGDIKMKQMTRPEWDIYEGWKVGSMKTATIKGNFE